MIKSNPPCGYLGGTSWDDCGKHKISRIYVTMKTNRKLASIQFGYIDEQNAVVLSDRHGGEGPNYSVVELNYPLEHITSVTGSYEHNRITSIAFETNNSKYGPFGIGNESDETFKMEMENDFYGFHGYADSSDLNAIGVYLHCQVQRSMEEKGIIKWTACGYCNGTPWGDYSKNRISIIYIVTDEHGELASVQFAFTGEENNTQSPVPSNRYGSGEGRRYKMEKLHSPSEYITSISGTYGRNRGGYDAILSITFTTNHNKYGPFGSLHGRDFTFDIEDQFYGCHGYSDENNLLAIGVYLKPKVSQSDTGTTSTFGSAPTLTAATSLPTISHGW